MATSTWSAFLRAELAPTPGRTRATLRVLVASLVATVLVMGTHVPHGHWIVFSIFTVSPEDAGASLLKGFERILGTVAGGAVGLLLAIAFANEPHFLFVAIGLAVALGMFLSRTTRAPYASLLATVTLLMVGVSHLDAPGAEVETALWRTLMILVGVALGTGAQVFLWPSDPEDRLLDDLAERLAAAERVFQQALSPAPAGLEAPAPPLLALSGLARELDLLASAEARYPALRRRHTEQIALIGEVERILTGALWLTEVSRRPDAIRPLDAAERSRVAALAAACATARTSIAARRPVEGDLIRAIGEVDVAELPAYSAPNLITHLEATVGRIAAATAFLGRGREPRAGEPGHSPLDTPARAPFFTPAFSLANSADMKFALKCALAVLICFVAMLGLDWPGLLTSAITCPLVAQSTLGASLYKSLLRLAGAAVGGLLGLAAIVAVMPNAETLAGLFLPLAAGFGLAAWITAGSSRISYVGLQVGMSLGMCVLDVFGPTTDLVPPRDRVLGIILGVAVMGLVHDLIWPVRASRAMRPALAEALRAMAVLAGLAPEPRDHVAAIARAARHRLSVYRALASALRLREEALSEPGALAPAARAQRDRVLALAGEAQRAFLAVLALARHRLARTAVPLPPALGEPLADFDRAVGRLLDASATVLERPGEPRSAGPLSSPDLPEHLAELERCLARATNLPQTDDAPALAFTQASIPLRRAVVAELRRLALALRADRQPLWVQ